MTSRRTVSGSSITGRPEAAPRVGWRPSYYSLSSASRALLLILCGLPLVQGQVRAQSAEVNQVKAAYLYNFAKFVEWPPESFRSADDPAIICSVGDERTAEVLRQAVSGKKANGRRVEARYPRTAQEFKSCHVLFIGFADKGRILDILHDLQNTHVLTVGQSEQFISLGGMINLAQNSSTIGLEINPDSAEAAGLKISSRLLVVSRVAGSGHRGSGL